MKWNLLLCSLLRNTLDFKADCITGVIINRTEKEDICDKDLEIGESNAIKVTVEAMKELANIRDF